MIKGNSMATPIIINYNELNAEQGNAVFGKGRRILCLAGAGTGKTRVLTHRVARLYGAGVSPENMLALTFTRAAGAEMKGRVIGLIGDDGKKLFCNTFHAFCLEVIRGHAGLFGYGPDFNVYDQNEANGLAGKVINELQVKISPAKLFSYRTGNGFTLKLIEQKEAKRAAKEYEYQLKRNNALDFDGLINVIKKALSGDGGPAVALRNKYKHVFVDEFQDTDPKQWEILRLLNPDNLFAVGDDNQSIYGFRGADVGIILGLALDPEWHVIKLELNYRSTAPIVAAANNLIKHNINQTDKILLSFKLGVDIEVRRPLNEMEEISNICHLLKSKLTTGRSTAVLMRTNRQLEFVKNYLKANKIDYECAADDLNIFDTKDAHALIAWLSMAINPNNDSFIRTIALYDIGNLAFKKIELMQMQNGLSFEEALAKTDEHISSVNNYKMTASLISPATNVMEAASFFAASAGSKWGGISIGPHILLEIGEWQKKQEALGESCDTKTFLDWIKFRSVIDEPVKKIDPKAVYLSTIHGAKGLEFDDVYIIGANQESFPANRPIEEERRLFYVAITRARNYLNISAPMAVMDWNGVIKPAECSQFIGEMGLD